MQRCESYNEFEIEKCQPDQVVGEVEKLKADQQEAMVGLLYIVKTSDLTLICYTIKTCLSCILPLV